MPRAEKYELARMTRAERRALDLIESDPELRRSVIEAPSADSREELLAERFKLPLGNRGKIERARLLFGAQLGSLVDFAAIPRLYFRPLDSSESIAHFQGAVSRSYPEAKVAYLKAMEELRDCTVLALGDREGLERALAAIPAEERSLRTQELKALHRATLALFDNELSPDGPFIDGGPVSVLLGSWRAAETQEIAELSRAAFGAIEQTDHGRELRAMVLANLEIRRVHQGEKDMATTSTNYSVPPANYWLWSFGSGGPVRIPTLSPDEARSARSIWQHSPQRSLRCPWVELENLRA